MVQMRQKFNLGLILACLVILLVGCNDIGNLRINVYDKQQSLLNDVYVGLYRADFERRIDFKYTTRGEVQFKGLASGTYRVKMIKHDLEKRIRVQVKGEETNYLKVDLLD
jgi:hypothetical protein